MSRPFRPKEVIVQHLRMWLFGASLLLLTFVGPAVLPVAPRAEAAKVAKTSVCHFDKDTKTYSYLLIPTKQIDKGVGHARHTDDKFGLSLDDCLALNEVA